MTCFSEVMRLTTSVSPETVTIITQNTASSPPRKFNLIVVCGVVASRVTVWDVTETVLLCQQLNIEKYVIMLTAMCQSPIMMTDIMGGLRY